MRCNGMGSGYLTTIRRRKRVNITQQSTNIGVGTNYGINRINRIE